MNAVWPHLPALQVVIPLIGALLAALSAPRQGRLRARAAGELAHAAHRRRDAVAGAVDSGRSRITSAAGSRRGASNTASMR